MTDDQTNLSVHVNTYIHDFNETQQTFNTPLNADKHEYDHVVNGVFMHDLYVGLSLPRCKPDTQSKQHKKNKKTIRPIIKYSTI